MIIVFFNNNNKTVNIPPQDIDGVPRAFRQGSAHHGLEPAAETDHDRGGVWGGAGCEDCGGAPSCKFFLSFFAPPHDIFFNYFYLFLLELEEWPFFFESITCLSLPSF